MIVFAAMVFGGLILIGLTSVANSLDRIAKQICRTNDLKESDLRTNEGTVGKPPVGPN